ncbi:MAG: hypothetical protein Q8M15_14640 [Bacteroidota bacterium]|nr:hypothetical protein [Bacteroidota bacterium]
MERKNLTSTEKLLKKEFGITSEIELYNLINSKNQAFFETNLFIDKASYLAKLKSLINSINDDGDSYSEYVSMAKSGSVIASAFTSVGVGEIMKNYQANRKTLVNHMRFFMK